MQDVSINTDQDKDLFVFAQETIVAAGDIARNYFRKTMHVDSKGSAFDPVTVADREIEAYIRACITSEYPDHSIIGEEEDNYTGSSDYRWVIDPIDGTRSFISGSPLWGILLGLMHGNKPVLGLMHQPYTSEVYIGSETGAYLLRDNQQEKISSRHTKHIKEATIYTTHPEHFESDDDLSAYLTLANSCQLSRYGGDCYSYCLLALGTIDLVIETGLAPYDIIPLIPIVESAGGVISNWEGESAIHGGRIIAASSRELYDQAILYLQ